MNTSDIYRPRVPRRVVTHGIRDVELAVSEWGDPDSPLLVWLHGWGDTGETAQFVVDELAGDWFVVAPDFRGFGDSVATQASFWFPDYLADLDRLLDVYSPDTPVRLAGHSMGGNVGGLYAGIFPERVRAFVKVEGFGLPDTDPADAPGRYRAWIEKSRNGPRFANYADYAAFAARIGRDNPRMGAAEALFVARAWGRRVDGQVTLRANPRHRLPNPVLYRRAEAEACWANVSAPVLLIAGAESPVFSAAGGSEQALVDRLVFPDARASVVADAGHMLHFDAPAALAAELDGFLAGLVNSYSTV